MYLKQHIFFFILITTLAFSQQEASVWYFGNQAGIKFHADGTISSLIDGQLNTNEGCATIADTNGNLLFYTDGMKIWNRNHQLMPNGSGLMGNDSSTQSATIVPKPGSSNLFYVFTLDYEVHPNGFRYSIVDMNLNGGLGDVTSDKNVLIYTPSNEKLSITKHANGVDYWVVTHGFGNNTFYSHLLTASGLSTTPVISNIGTVISGSTDNVWGYMKITPDGTKLAICNLLNVELFDFDFNTGVISNPRILFTTGFEGPYGAEFSPDNNVLYVTIPNPHKVIQYNLLASDIASSAVEINTSTIYPCALQLGPDGKIYIAELFKDKLGVISNPNVVGVGCNLQMDAVDLAGRQCIMGLPPFVTSFFFNPLIQSNNVCEGDVSHFSINTNQTITSVTWDYGDGSPVQNSVNGSHTYAAPNTYTVTAIVTTTIGTRTNTRSVTIYPKPVITPVATLKQCDDNIDGFSVFNLTQANSLLSTNAANETFAYFETASDAQNNINSITNYTTYTNQVVSNDVIYVRVSNANGCFKVATLNLNVSTTQIPPNFQRVFTVCDDAVLGTNTDGVSAFDFSSVTTQIQSLFPVGQQLVIAYYQNLADALAEQHAITNTTNYRNISSPNAQTIYIRVDSANNNECLGLGQHITLHVERIPVVSPMAFAHCDDDQDGMYAFNTATVQSTLLHGMTGVSVAYYDQNNTPLPSPLPNPFVTASQAITAVVTNTTTTRCSDQTTITFTVDDLPEAFPIPTTLTTVCDDEAVPTLQDGKYAFDTSSYQNTILGGQTGMQLRYYDQNNHPLPSPLPNPFVTGTQNIRVEVINPNNNACTATQIIPFVVKPVPNINLFGDELVCSNNTTFTKIIDAGIIDSTLPSAYTYVWKRDGVLIPMATNYALTVNQEGVYTVEVFNAQGCSRTRTITVTASDIATITHVAITDLSDTNSVTVTVSGQGDYVYSLDGVNWQSSNVFEPVASGVYTVYVKDLNGCGIANEEVNVLGIPAYFTPNGDGYHDYWNIKGVSTKSNADSVVSIFDRFGKLIKQISSQSLGWDGTLNSEPLPATDYWYSITLEDGRVVKGHFALKR